MNRIFNYNKAIPYILIILIYLFLVFIISPVGDFPLNDDWSYAKSVWYLIYQHKVLFTWWTVTSLMAQVLWGSLFCFIFGFSFTVLRVSTIVLSCIGILYFYSILQELGHSRLNSFLVCLLLIFNPLYFSLSYTFMTEIPFCTFSIISVYFYMRGIKRDRFPDFITGSFFATLSVLTRQCGIVIPISILLYYIITRKIDFKSFFILLIPFVGMTIFYLWVWKGHGLTSQFINIGSGYMANFLNRWKVPLALLRDTIVYFHYIGLFVVPIIGGLLLNLKWARVKTSLFRNFIIGIFLFGLVYCIKIVPLFPSIGNIVNNFGVGPILVYGGERLVVKEIAFWKIITWCGIIGEMSVFSILTILFVKKKAHLVWIPYLIIGGYLLFLFFMPFILDRYFLFLLPWVIILLMEMEREWNFFRGGIYPTLLVPFIFFSVISTHDYLAWNRARWEGINNLLKKKVSPEQIEGGFEYDMWNFYRFSAPMPKYYVNLTEYMPQDQRLVQKIRIKSPFGGYIYVKEVLD